MRRSDAEFHIVGTIRGLASEASRVEAAFGAIRPDAVALGVGPEDLEGLARFSEGAEYEHEYSLSDEIYSHFLEQFGEVSLPPRDLVAAVRLAREHGLEVVPIDMPEHAYVDLFTDSVGALQLLRYQRRLRRLAAKPLAGRTAMEWHLAWDEEVTRLRGFARVERVREDRMAERLQAFPHGGTVLVLLEAARVEGVMRRLEAASGAERGAGSQPIAASAKVSGK